MYFEATLKWEFSKRSFEFNISKIVINFFISLLLLFSLTRGILFWAVLIFSKMILMSDCSGTFFFEFQSMHRFSYTCTGPNTGAFNNDSLQIFWRGARRYTTLDCSAHNLLWKCEPREADDESSDKLGTICDLQKLHRIQGCDQHSVYSKWAVEGRPARSHRQTCVAAGQFAKTSICILENFLLIICKKRTLPR